MKNVKIIAAEEISRDQRVLKEAKYIYELGYDVEILCWDRENEFVAKEVEYIDNVKIKRFFPKSLYGSGWRQIIPFIKFIIELKKHLKNQEYEYLHCQNLDGFIVGYLINNRKKIIFDMREFYEGREKNKVKKLVIKNIVRFGIKKSHNIIYVNNTQISNIKQEYRGKLIYLPNYPSELLGKSIKKVETNLLNISYIGGVRQYDEFKNLFEATKKIEKIRVNIHGMGTAYNRLKAIEDEYTNVNMTGRYNPSQTAELYGSSNIIYCVYSMNNENWRTAYPIKFYESIVTKTPIIVSKGSVLEEFLKENDIGFVVDGDNIEEIRLLIEDIKNNINILDEKVRNLEKIQFEYTWENVVNNLNFIYKSIESS